MWVLELVKLFIDFSFILPPANSEHELKQTTGSHRSWKAKVFGKKKCLTKSFYTTTEKRKVFLSEVKCMKIPVSKF